MSEKLIWLTIFLMAVVTWLPRLLPVWLLAGRTLPPLVVIWLRYVPVAVLAAMLMPELLLNNGSLNFHFSNFYFWVAIPTIFVAWKSKSMVLTVVTGMGLLALIRLWLG